MYTRYVRGTDGIYRRQRMPDAPEHAPEPAPTPPEPENFEPVLPETARPAPQPGETKPPGLLTSLLSRQFDTDDLLLAAIVLLLLLDGGEEDYVALLAALAFLLF